LQDLHCKSCYYIQSRLCSVVTWHSEILIPRAQHHLGTEKVMIVTGSPNLSFSNDYVDGPEDLHKCNGSDYIGNATENSLYKKI